MSNRSASRRRLCSTLASSSSIQACACCSAATWRRRAASCSARCALRATVAAADRLDTLRPLLADIGVRHQGYGVRAEHYDTVGAALLWTLQRGLQANYSAETDTAWHVAYAVVAQAMQSTLLQAAQA